MLEQLLGWVGGGAVGEYGTGPVLCVCDFPLNVLFLCSSHLSDSEMDAIRFSSHVLLCAHEAANPFVFMYICNWKRSVTSWGAARSPVQTESCRPWTIRCRQKQQNKLLTGRKAGSFILLTLFRCFFSSPDVLASPESCEETQS